MSALVIRRSSDYVALAAEVVSAFVGHNSLAGFRTSQPDFFRSCRALVKISGGQSGFSFVTTEPEVLTPAVPVRKSITPDYLVCLDDGRKFKSLKRHLASLGMTPDQYRTKWSLAGRLSHGRLQLRGDPLGARQEDRPGSEPQARLTS